MAHPLGGTNSHLPSFHVAGVAQWHIHLVTSTHPPSFCVAGVALMALGGALGLAWAPVTPRLAWQAWHKLTPTVVLRGRRGTNSHPPSFWQAWHKLTSTVVLRGRRGTHGTGWRAWTGLGACDAAALCVAGVAQTHTYCRFAWQAWHKLTSTVVLRGRRTGWRAWTGLGARDAAPLCVAGVPQPDVHLRFTWQAWHKLTSTVVLRGRRGTHGTGWRAWTGLGARDAAALCVAGMAQTHTYCRFGRRGTNSHPPSFCVAGVALMALGGALGLAWAPVTTLRGRRGTTWHPPSFHVAGVAQTHIHRRFAWQAWHSWHWVACLDWLGRLWRRGTLRGRRGTNSHLLSFQWQAWHS